jgi:hypothetical protein
MRMALIFLHSRSSKHIVCEANSTRRQASTWRLNGPHAAVTCHSSGRKQLTHPFVALSRTEPAELGHVGTVLCAYDVLCTDGWMDAFKAYRFEQDGF